MVAVRSLLLVTLAATPALAQAPTLRAGRRTSDVKLDGKLEEPAWSTAQGTIAFTQSYPQPGKEPTQRTELRVLYDDEAIYVGVRAFDSRPDSIASQLARRDATGIYSDWIHVVIDSYHDRRTGFRFSVNPRGVQKDVLQIDGAAEDVNWDAVWEAVTSVDDKGWTAEYRIPLSQLRFGAAPAGGERVWGLQVQRDIARSSERTTWSPWTPQDGSYVAKFGDLTGIVGVEAPHRMEVLPYVSSQVTRAPVAPLNPFSKHERTKAAFGADVKSGLPGGLTLTGTINPDFGQVEVDPAVVNLTAFETFFPEKRPFFVEGAGIFNFGNVRTFNSYQFQQYFYSRRIGRTPQRSLVPFEASYADPPAQTTILGAGKVSGRLKGWTLGLIDALTDEEKADYRLGTLDSTAVVEPRTNYAIGRLRRDFRRGSTVVGGMFTASNRDMGDTSIAKLLRSSAYMGGIDFEHGWKRQQWFLSGYVAGSEIRGRDNVIAAAQRSSARYYQRPDADYIDLDATRESLGGYITELALQRNAPWFMSLDVKAASPGFEINDVGFMGRVDYRSVSGLVGYQNFRAGKRLRNYTAWIGQVAAWNFGGDQITNAFFSGGNTTTNTFIFASYNVQMGTSVLSDRLTRGGPLARTPRAMNGQLNLGTDTRKLVFFNFNVNGQKDAIGGWTRGGSFMVTARPTSFVRASIAPVISSLRTKQQYQTASNDALATGTFGRRYIFGDLRQTTLSMDTRLDWTFTPTLTFQLYAQPFVSAGRYSAFNELREAGTDRFATFGDNYGTVTRDAKTRVFTVDPDGTGPAPSIALGNPDFNIRSLRGNAVVRWEYRPGSTVFFVWQQQRAGSAAFGDFDFSRDSQAIFDVMPTNVFLIKASYWFAR